ncbi:MAG: hypothetical protein ACJA0E_001279 [Bermanella sp.]|jgi:hypothetical protein
MVLEGSSDIIVRCEYIDKGAHEGTQWLTFRNGFVLILAVDAMALYKSADSIVDPLGNGLKDMVELKGSAKLVSASGGLVSSFTAGFVGLMDDKAILITPNDIQLFANKQDALYNRQELGRLELA